MKKKNWYRGLSLADDKYIAEAHPDNIVKKKRKPVWIPIVAACACLALILGNAWLFVPVRSTPPRPTYRNMLIANTTASFKS